MVMRKFDMIWPVCGYVFEFDILSLEGILEPPIIMGNNLKERGGKIEGPREAFFGRIP